MTGACLFVGVVGLGFDSTSPTFVRSRASHAAGSDGRLAKKNKSGPRFWGQGCVDTICTNVCSIQTSCRMCLFGTARTPPYELRIGLSRFSAQGRKSSSQLFYPLSTNISNLLQTNTVLGQITRPPRLCCR